MAIFSIQEVFSANGPLAAGIPGYRQREQQIEMAEHIASAMAEKRVLVAEAGTGTGKTFAYLVPVSYTHLDVYKRQPLRIPE